MPPTPQQHSLSSTGEMQANSWHARDRKVTARMEQYLKASDCLKLDLEELELLLGPEDSEVNLKENLEECEQEKRQDFRDLQCERKKRALCCKQSAMG